MSTVQQALARLNRCVGNLEVSLSYLEQNLVGKQRDMFPAAPVVPPANNNVELVAKRLDSVIERIEDALKEGAA